MKTKKTKNDSNFQEVDLKDVHRGDTIFIDDSINSIPYTLIDKGTSNEEFILILNQLTHFGNLYKFNKLYKKI